MNRFRTLLYVLLYISCLALTSCVTFPHTKLNTPPQRATAFDRKAPIWVICGELHSDVVVETQWLIDYGCNLPESVKRYKYLCMGWGDRVAYTHRWGLDDVPNALFRPSQSIVQIVGFNGQVVPTFPNQECVKAEVRYSNGASFVNFINQSFAYAPQTTNPMILQPARWGHGYFIHSPYAYFLPRMCNQWIATALQSAGIYTTKPTRTMSSQTLKKQMIRYNLETQTL